MNLKYRKQLYLPIFLLLISACAGRQPLYKQTGNYTVTVVSNGEIVEDFNHSLVHRVSIGKEQLTELKEKFNDKQISSYIETDLRGNAIGVVITAKQPKVFVVLALEKGDILTAVNKERAKHSRILQTLFSSLEENSQTTVTVQRQGLPHKLIYSILSDSELEESESS